MVEMEQSLVSCAVVSSDPTFCARIATLVADPKMGVKLTAEVTTPLIELEPQVVEQIRRSDARIVFLDLGSDPALGLRFARLLSEADPGRTFILAGPGQADPEILLEAMRVGASEYLPQPIDEADLAAALGRAMRRLGSGLRATDPGEKGKIIAVLSAKGGTGVTTMAVNLAVHIREATNRPTLLLDMDLELGDSAMLIGLQARYSIFDVVRNLRRLDQNLLASLVEHHKSGLDVLASPTQLNSGEAINKDQVRAALQFLRRHYRTIVMDLPRTVTATTIAALELADQVLIMTTPNIAVLRNTKKVLPLVHQAAGSDPNRVRVILNLKKGDDLITDDDVNKALGAEIYWTLPRDDAAADLSVNEGVPVVQRPKSKFARDLRALGSALAGVNGKNGTKKGGLVAGLLRPFRSGD